MRRWDIIKNLSNIIKDTKTYREYKKEITKLEQSGQFKEIKVESFWGCVASFFLFQIFGYIIYQSFLHHLDPSSLLPLPIGFIWIVVFMFGESGTMYHIRKFFAQQGSQKALQSLHSIDDIAKMLLSAVFAIMLVLIYLGYYPFPKKEVSFIHLIAFYVISWFVSYLTSFGVEKYGGKLKQNKDRSAIIGGIIIGSVFVAFSLVFNPVLFYLFGLMGLGVMVFLANPLLLEDQIKIRYVQ